MRREQALQFVGAMVEAHTSMNGEYVGQLVEVTTDRPWRGRVLLTGVLAPAAIEDSYGTRQRRGHKLGTILVSKAISKSKSDAIRYLMQLEDGTAKLIKWSPWIERAISAMIAERSDLLELRRVERVTQMGIVPEQRPFASTKGREVVRAQNRPQRGGPKSS